MGLLGIWPERSWLGFQIRMSSDWLRQQKKRFIWALIKHGKGIGYRMFLTRLSVWPWSQGFRLCAGLLVMGSGGVCTRTPRYRILAGREKGLNSKEE